MFKRSRKILAQLLSNNYGGSGGAGVLDSAPFLAELTHTAVPQRAAPGTTATFTRATTATFKDHEGVQRTVPSGCARFEGARYVRNLLTFTEDFSNAAWVDSGTVTKTATTITETATANDHGIRYTVAVGKNIVQLKVKPNGRTRCALASTGSTNKSAIFNLTTVAVEGALTDAFTTLGDNPTITLQSDGYYLITMGNLSGSTTLFDFYLLNDSTTARQYAGDITKGMFLKQAQLEDITGRSDQTTPSSYVSQGALDYRSEQDPLYLSLPGTAGHYASTPDSVAASVVGDIELQTRALITDVSPAVAQTLIAKWTSAPNVAYLFRLGTDGKMYLYTSADGTTVRTHASSVTAAVAGLVDGTAYWFKVTRSASTGVVKFYFAADTTGTPSYTQWGADVAGTVEGIADTNAIVTLGFDNGSALLNGRIFSAQIYSTIGGATPVVDFNPHRDATTPTGTITSSTTGEVWTLNGASSVVRNATYHGAGVDGVEFFNTDLSGNPLPTQYTYDAVSLNGVAGTYVSTPDSVALNITGSMSVIVKAALTSWTPAANTALIAQRPSAGGWQLGISPTTGLLFMTIWTGGTPRSLPSTVAPGFSAGATGWIKADYSQSATSVTFYTSSDGVSWSQLGDVAVNALVTAIDDSSGAVELGAITVGANFNLSGKIYQAQIYNGINGTLAVDFDASRYAGGTTLTGSTGETWTLQGNAVIHPTNYPALGYNAEGSRENKCLQSNAFTTTWTAAGTPAATQNAVGPDGATSAWTLTDNGGAASEGVFQSTTLTAAAHTFSYFVKKTTSATAFPVIYTNTAGNVYAMATVDTNNGVATAWTSTILGTTASGVSARCSSFNADFWRVELTWTATAVAWFFYIFPALTTNATQSTGTLDVAAQGSAVFYGAQVELGSFASSYIPTTTAAVTRNADSDTYQTAGNFSDTAGTMYAEVTYDVWANAVGSIVGSSTQGMMPLATNSGVKGYDGTNTVNGTAGTPAGTVKMAVAWTGTTMKVCGNGTAVVSGTYDTGWNLTSIGIGLDSFAKVRNVRVWGRALSDSELQAVTR